MEHAGKAVVDVVARLCNGKVCDRFIFTGPVLFVEMVGLPHDICGLGIPALVLNFQNRRFKR